ncbi:MAG: glycerol-3-phosphate acyltransferase [Dehalococcoidia bacterium]|nr:glycerol-3-phosphate acyltransferase [Dehalococcoidia bacterium]
MAVEFVLLLLAAYLFGSVPAAYLAAKWSRGIDIRQYGSGNVGATNLLGLTSKWIAIVAIIFDAAKGMVMVWAAQLIGLGIAQQVPIGLAVIIGHNWPVFLRFSGGRGLLTIMGLAFFLPLINGLIPWEIIAFFAVAAVSLFTIHNIPLGTGAGVAAMPLVSWGVDEPLPMTLGFVAMFLLLVIRRLTAPKTSVTASVPPGQLVLNRLLFDRDIRDREAWIRRQPVKREEKQGEG